MPSWWMEASRTQPVPLSIHPVCADADGGQSTLPGAMKERTGGPHRAGLEGEETWFPIKKRDALEGFQKGRDGQGAGEGVATKGWHCAPLKAFPSLG